MDNHVGVKSQQKISCRVQRKKGVVDFWLKLNIAKSAPNFACWFVY